MRQKETSLHSGTVVQSLSTPPSLESSGRHSEGRPIGGEAPCTAANGGVRERGWRGRPQGGAGSRARRLRLFSLCLRWRRGRLSPPRLPRLPVPARPASLSFPFAAMAATAEQEQFYLLLGNLLSPDNAVRKQAEVTGPPCPGLGRQAGLSDLADLAGGSGGGRAGRRRGQPSPTCEQRHQLLPGRPGAFPQRRRRPGAGTAERLWRFPHGGARGSLRPLGESEGSGRWRARRAHEGARGLVSPPPSPHPACLASLGRLVPALPVGSLRSPLPRGCFLPVAHGEMGPELADLPERGPEAERVVGPVFAGS